MLQKTRGLHAATPTPNKKLEAEGAGVAAWWSSNYPSIAEAVRKLAKEHKKKKAKALKYNQKAIQYFASAEQRTQQAMVTPAKNVNQRQDEPYENALELPDTGRVSPFKNRKYKASEFIGLDLSRMRPIVFVSDNETGPNFIQADVLDHISVDSIRQRDMTDLCIAFDTKVIVSGSSTLHLRLVNHEIASMLTL